MARRRDELAKNARRLYTTMSRKGGRRVLPMGDPVFSLQPLLMSRDPIDDPQLSSHNVSSNHAPWRFERSDTLLVLGGFL